MQNLSKAHEKNVQTGVHAEQVGNILDNVENVPYALRGSMTKTILYWLFCLIAASELTAALFFYVASLGVNVYVAAVIGTAIGFTFHGLLHSILTDTTKGMVFSKSRESKAMSNEVKANIVLSIALLLMAACTVFFVGKKGFAAFRATKYETAQAESKPKEGIKSIEITADMLTNKKGKISSDKLEQLAAVTTATAKATDTKSNAAKQDRDSYDTTTVNVTDIVGASAFVLELLLALLAYSIATAKFAATYDEIARRNAQDTPSVLHGITVQNAEKPSVEASVGDKKTANHTPFGFSDNSASKTGNEGRTIVKGFQRNTEKASVEASVEASVDKKDSNLRVCEWCDEYYVYSIHNQKFCCADCRTASYEARTGKKVVKGKAFK